VPPDSETIEEFTAMMYAMAKKVARPARISVKKREPLRSRGYHEVLSAMRLRPQELGMTYMAGSFKLKPTTNSAGRDLVICVLHPTHLESQVGSKA
jgi:hypothetical protein